MSYVENQLSNGECVVYRTRLHWLRYGWSAAWIVTGALQVVSTERSVLGLMMITFGVYLAAVAFLDVVSAEFVVTNKRVFLKRGFFRRQSVEVLLGQIESMTVDQSIIGRALDYGSLVPGGSGGTKQPFKWIAKPLAFRQKVNEQIEAATTA